MIEKITEELALLVPENKGLYEENAQKYIDSLEAVDTEIQKSIAESGVEHFIVYHPSFGYFAEDYGLQMLALEKEGKEATAKQMASIIDFAREHNIKTIFYQAEIDSKQSKILAEEIGGKAIMLEPLSGDYLDNLRRIAALFSEL